MELKTMKKLLTIAMVAFAAVAAKADIYLYWTVDVQDTFVAGASRAELIGVNSDGYTTIQKMNAYTTGNFFASDAQLASGTNGSPYTNYLVRLYDAQLTAIAESTMLTDTQLSALEQSIWTGVSSTERPAANPYSFSGFVIPEPTSGLLLLLGLAGLALKRK